MTQTQESLRGERESLFAELENACGKIKETIQLARKYYREERAANAQPQIESAQNTEERKPTLMTAGDER
jgi:hypothetical protein